ncbi:hypothetical protein ABIA39_009003 [Nocardia sp. GAS34]
MTSSDQTPTDEEPQAGAAQLRMARANDDEEEVNDGDKVVVSRDE